MIYDMIKEKKKIRDERMKNFIEKHLLKKPVTLKNILNRSEIKEKKRHFDNETDEISKNPFILENYDEKKNSLTRLFTHQKFFDIKMNRLNKTQKETSAKKNKKKINFFEFDQKVLLNNDFKKKFDDYRANYSDKKNDVKAKTPVKNLDISLKEIPFVNKFFDRRYTTDNVLKNSLHKTSVKKERTTNKRLELDLSLLPLKYHTDKLIKSKQNCKNHKF